MNKTKFTHFLLFCLFFSFIYHSVTFAKLPSKEELLTKNKTEYSNKEISKLLNQAVKYRRCNFDTTLHFLNSAMALADKQTNRYWQGMVQLEMGRAYMQVGKYEESLTALRSSHKLLATVTTTFEMIDCHHELGKLYAYTGNFPKSKDELTIAEQIFNNKSEDEKKNINIEKVYSAIAISYFRLREKELAIKYHTKAITGAQEKSNYPLLYRSFYNLGVFYMAHKEYDNAYDNLSKAMEINKIVRDTVRKGVIENQLSKYYLAVGKHQKSVEFAEIALKELETSNNIRSKASVYANLYDVYCAIKDYEKAILYLEKYHDVYLQLQSNTLNERILKKDFEIQEKQHLLAIEQQNFHILLLIAGLTIFLLLFVIGGMFYFKNSKKEKIKHERLQEEILHKNKELTTHTLFSSEKNNIIKSTIQQLNLLKVKLKKSEAHEIQKISWNLHSTINHDIWQEFELRFKEIHASFNQQLQNRFPKLSPSERRLACFLRLNMSTKEISQLTGQSVRSLEVARYRLRKSLGITNQNINLVSFIHDIDNTESHKKSLFRFSSSTN